MAAERIAALLLLHALCGCLADPGHCDAADPGCAAGSDSTQSEIERQLPAEDELSVQLLQKKAKKKMTSSDTEEASAKSSHSAQNSGYNCGAVLGLDARFCATTQAYGYANCTASKLHKGDIVPLRIRVINNVNYELYVNGVDVVNYVPAKLVGGKNKRVQIVFNPNDLKYVPNSFKSDDCSGLTESSASQFTGHYSCENPDGCVHFTIGNDIPLGEQETKEIAAIKMEVLRRPLDGKIRIKFATDKETAETTGNICTDENLGGTELTMSANAERTVGIVQKKCAGNFHCGALEKKVDGDTMCPDDGCTQEKCCEACPECVEDCADNNCAKCDGGTCTECVHGYTLDSNTMSCKATCASYTGQCGAREKNVDGDTLCPEDGCNQAICCEAWYTLLDYGEECSECLTEEVCTAIAVAERSATTERETEWSENTCSQDLRQGARERHGQGQWVSGQGEPSKCDTATLTNLKIIKDDLADNRPCGCYNSVHDNCRMCRHVYYNNGNVPEDQKEITAYKYPRRQYCTPGGKREA